MERSRDSPNTTKQLYSTDLWQSSKKKKKNTLEGKKVFSTNDARAVGCIY